MSERPSSTFVPPVFSGRRDEGWRGLRNLLSLGTALIAPLQVRVMTAALTPNGYGRWWWTFGILELISAFGMIGADLYIRREVPRLAEAGDEAAIHETVGSGLLLTTLTSAAMSLLLWILAVPLSHAQKDPGLLPYLLLLAAQPLLWNLGNLLGSALQSLDVLGSLAFVRGLVLPVLQLGLLALCAQRAMPVQVALLMMIAVSAIGVVIVALLYRRHLPLGKTLRAALRPTLLSPILRYGAPLLVPGLLWNLGGKLDLYVLGSTYPPDQLGAYAACLQFASYVPTVRALLDPIAQAQIGALRTSHREEMFDSLRRMARLCALGAAPAFAVVVAIGSPLIGLLMRRDVAFTRFPLGILCIGQLIGSLAIASWLLSMTRAGVLVGLVAGVTLLCKLGLLLLLVPVLGFVGAAIATTCGTILAQQGQALLGAGARERLYGSGVALGIAVAVVGAVAGRFVYGASHALGSVPSLLAGGGAAAFVCLLAAPLLLSSEERARLRSHLLGRGDRR